MLLYIHFPVQLSLAGHSFPLHTITEVLGIFIGFRYFLFLKKRKGDVIESSNRVWILIAACFGAVVGSRLLGALENPVEWLHAENKMMYAYMQKTIVGGLLGGLFCVEVGKLFLREKNNSGDLFVFPLMLAMIIGRIGCFSMGVYEETYGLTSLLPWAMDLGDGIRRHPVALYEIVFLLLLWIGCYRLFQKVKPVNGDLFKLFMVSYLCFRFVLEFIKPHVVIALELSSIQWACVAGLLWYAGIFIARLKQRQQMLITGN